MITFIHMHSLEDSYDVNGVHLKWNQLFAEVIPRVMHLPKLKPYTGGWANLRVQGSSVFGLKTSHVEIRAPFEDRPVMQLIYELAPITVTDERDLHTRFVEPL